MIGLAPYQARRIAFNINIPKESINKAVKFLIALYNVFIEKIVQSLKLIHLF